MTSTIGRSSVAAVLAAGSILMTSCTSSTAPSHPSVPATGNPAAASGAGTSAGPSTKPCALLTQAEAEVAAGQKLGPGDQTATLDDCQWTTADFAAGVSVSVSDWSAITAAAHGNGARPTSISGVGGEALNLNGSEGSNLYVRKGGMGFLLTINGPHVDTLPDHGLAKEEVLATAILGRL